MLFRNGELDWVKRAEVESSESWRGRSNWGGGKI